LITLLGAGTAASNALAQKNNKNRRRLPKYRLNDNLPSVFLSAVKIEKTESLNSKEDETYVWLKLHNNTRWPIWTSTSGVPKKFGGREAEHSVCFLTSQLPKNNAS